MLRSIQDREDYHPDIPSNDFRRSLDQYPCIRVHFDEADANIWAKLELFLKLDDQLSPLDAEELPLIVNLRENFHLEDYTKLFILEDANFRMMGSNDFGHPVIYYHIIMVVDQQSFRDGTLLHVDFNRSGDPALSFRYPAIRSFLPWKWHHDSPEAKLERLNEYLYENGLAIGNGYVLSILFRNASPSVVCLLAHSCTNLFPTQRSMNLAQPVVDILVDEMDLRGVLPEEDGDLRLLAIEAVHTVNEQLLGT